MPWRRRRAVDREPMRRDDRRQSAATPPSRLRVLPVRRRDGCHVAAPAPTACRPPHPGPSPDDRRRLSRAEPRISRGGPGADRKSRRGEGDSGRLLRVTASRAPTATSSRRILRLHRGARSWCGVGARFGLRGLRLARRYAFAFCGRSRGWDAELAGALPGRRPSGDIDCPSRLYRTRPQSVPKTGAVRRHGTDGGGRRPRRRPP